jgi:hypothetical protein
MAVRLRGLPIEAAKAEHEGLRPQRGECGCSEGERDENDGLEERERRRLSAD